MINRLWTLIEDEAASISKYYDNLGYYDITGEASGENKVMADIIKKIIAEKQDHLKALQYLLGTLCKDKPETNITEQAKTAISEYRESQKLIK